MSPGKPPNPLANYDFLNKKTAASHSDIPTQRPLPAPPVRGGAVVKGGESKARANRAQPVGTVRPKATFHGPPEAAHGDTAERVARTAPPFLISFCVHVLGLLLVSLWYVPETIKERVEVEVVYADSLGEQLLDDTFQSPASDLLEVEKPAFSVDVFAADDPLAAPPKLQIGSLAAAASMDITAPSIGLALTGREKGAKQALLAAYGGSAITEDAVHLALEWLKRHQRPDGTWSLIGPYSNGGGVENNLAATAMAMLALQGAGNTHLVGTYKKEVEKAAKALVKMQDSDGNFFRTGPEHHRLYSQAIATIAICELYGMSKDPAFRTPAQKALDYAARIQADDGEGGGGWRYYPKRDVDTSVTGWFVMAMQSGRMAGLEVQSPVLEKVSLYLDHATIEGGSQYRYRLNEGPSVTMTAEALLCRQYLGWSQAEPRLRSGVELILNNPIDWNDPNTYYWYYATQVLHHMGGNEWFTWNDQLRESLPAHQVKEGRERGSWDPSNDRWAGHGGRLYMTCLSVFMLEVYYRHLPIYKQRP